MNKFEELDGLKYEHLRLNKLSSAIQNKYLSTYELPEPEGMLSRDRLIEIIRHSSNSKEDLERNLRRAGWLDEC